jgi:hypothetical protein
MEVKKMKLDKKHIHTVRRLDDRFYSEGFAYKVFFKNHPKARAMGDSGRGVICLCTSASGGCVEFAHVVDGVDGIKVESVSLMVKTIEKYDIDIYMCYPEVTQIATLDIRVIVPCFALHGLPHTIGDGRRGKNLALSA